MCSVMSDSATPRDYSPPGPLILDSQGKNTEAVISSSRHEWVPAITHHQAEPRPCILPHPREHQDSREGRFFWNHWPLSGPVGSCRKPTQAPTHTWEVSPVLQLPAGLPGLLGPPPGSREMHSWCWSAQGPPELWPQSW